MLRRAALLLPLSLLGCQVVLPVLGYPPEAMREQPPTDIEATAAKIGGAAPGFSLPAVGGSHVTLASATSAGGAALIFYRGHW